MEKKKNKNKADQRTSDYQERVVKETLPELGAPSLMF